MKKLTKIKTLAIMIGFMMAGMIAGAQSIFITQNGVTKQLQDGDTVFYCKTTDNISLNILQIDTISGKLDTVSKTDQVGVSVVNMASCNSVYNNDSVSIPFVKYLHNTFSNNTNHNVDSILSAGIYFIYSQYDSLYQWQNTGIGQYNIGRNWTYRNGNCCNHFTSSYIKVCFIQRIPHGNICWVTVDSNSKYNVIIWDTTNLKGEAIDSFKIYYLNSKSKWEKIAEKSYKDSSYFIDTNSINNPNSNTVRYRMTSVNSCGNEEDTATSPWQNTMSITQAPAGTFNWGTTGYLIERNNTPVSTYILYRDDNGNGNWKPIDSVSGVLTSMTDATYQSNPSNYPNAKWYVGAELNIVGCPAPQSALIKRAESLNSTISKSNHVSNNGSITGISEINNELKSVVFPNPNNGSFKVNISNFSNKYIITIYNSLGQVINQNSLVKNDDEVKLNCTTGLYLYNITSEDGQYISKGKFIVQ